MIGIGIYVKNSPSALEMYKKAFDLELGYHVMNSDGTYFHSELSRKGEPFLSVVESKVDTIVPVNPVQLGVDFECRSDLENAFKILSQNGKVELDICELPWSPCAAKVTDRFGVNWFLSHPQHKPAEDWSPEE